jgi:predicted transcriptional regulator
MKYIKKTGKHKTEEGKANSLRIFNYFKENPNATQKDCAKQLGLSRQTVFNHIKKLKGE